MPCLSQVVQQNIFMMKKPELLDKTSFCTKRHQSLMTSRRIQYYLGEISFKQLGVLIYTVVRTPKHLYLVWFDEAGKYSFNREIVFSDIESKTKIESIKKGDDLDSVMQADKCGEYDFLFASWSGFPQISYHFFEDGSAYEIHYKDSVVSEVYVFTI